MRVTFVSPRSSYFYDRTPYIPLGISYLAASIRDIADEIDCIDGQMLSGDDYEQAIAKTASDIVCISATLLQMKEACSIAAKIKNTHPLSQVIIGGYGPHSIPYQDLFYVGQFDIFVRGEGELVLRRVLQQLKAGNDLREVSGIVFFENNEVVSTGPNLELPQLDVLPLPERELFNTRLYMETWQKSVGMTSLHIFASRGCPFSCIFCDKSITGRKYRGREPKLVVDEMQYVWQKYRPDDLFLFDDLFTLQKSQVLQVCKEIKQRGLNMQWSAQGRVGLVDMETLSALKVAGCTELFFGVESGSDSILSFLQKGFTREQVMKTFAACHEVGLRAGAYFIIGVPGETQEDIDLTIDLMRIIKPSLINLSFLTPFPNTKLHAKTAQWIGQRDWTKWDDFTETVYDFPFEANPQVSRRRILDAHKKLIEEGMDYSPYQLLR